MQARARECHSRTAQDAAAHSSSRTGRPRIRGHLFSDIALFRESQAIGPGLVVAVFDLLHHGRPLALRKTRPVAGRDGQKLQALQKRIAFVLGLFQHAPVEREPGSVAVEDSTEDCRARYGPWQCLPIIFPGIRLNRRLDPAFAARRTALRTDQYKASVSNESTWTTQSRHPLLQSCARLKKTAPGKHSLYSGCRPGATSSNSSGR